MTTVRIPPVLRAQVGGVKQVTATGSTVGQVLSALVEQHPQLREQLIGPDGGLHRFVNVYVNGRDVRYEGELEAPIGPDDTMVMLPAMAGGASSFAGAPSSCAPASRVLRAPSEPLRTAAPPPPLAAAPAAREATGSRRAAGLRSSLAW